MAITKISSCTHDLNFAYSLTVARGTNSPVKLTSSSWPRRIRLTRRFTLGTGTGKINTIGIYSALLASGGNATIDLYEGLVSPEGASVRMTKIRAFHLRVHLVDAADATDPCVLFRATGSYPWKHQNDGAVGSFLPTDDHGFRVGGGDGLDTTNALGFVVSSTSRHLQALNTYSGSIDRRVELIVAGEGSDL